MADSVKFGVTCTPIEEILTEESLSPRPTVIASEVGKSLSGSGSATVVNYAGAGSVQGYADGIVNYLNCVDDSATAISAHSSASFVFIKNTGYLFDSVTTLGVAMTEHVVVTTDNTEVTLISSLGPGEAIVLKALQSTKTLDCTKIKVQTFEANGSAAAGTDHLAVEILVVD